MKHRAMRVRCRSDLERRVRLRPRDWNAQQREREREVFVERAVDVAFCALALVAALAWVSW